jgi:hypothetical protein
MTREEFYNSVTSYADLLATARDYGYEDDFDDIVSDDHVRDRIQNMANEIGRGDDWENFASWVSDIPTGHEYLSYNSNDDSYERLNEDDDLRGRINELFEMLLDNGDIDEDIDDDDDDDYDDEDFYDEREDLQPV